MINTALWLSLLSTATAMLGVLPLGLAMGWLLARRQFVGKQFLNVLLLLPLVLPATVTGYYLLWLFGPQSSWSRLTGLSPLFHWSGAALAAGVVAFPLMMQSARAAFEGVPSELEEAAACLGQNPLQVFWRVSLPLARRGLLAGAMLSAARALGEFGATLMLAGNLAGRTQTLPLAIYEALLSGQDQAAWQMVLLLSGVSWVVLLVSLWLVSKDNKQQA